MAQDAATKAYVDAQVPGSQTLAATLLIGNSAGATQIDMNSQKIVNVLDPTVAQDAATKNYVDTNTVATNIYTADGTIVNANRTVLLTDAGEAGFALTFDLTGAGSRKSSVALTHLQASVSNVSTAGDISGVFATASRVLINAPLAGATHSIDLDFASGMIVTDSIQSRGLLYAADYSANFSARSLVDKGYVDAQVPGSQTLAATLLIGNTAGATTIDMQTQKIVDLGDPTAAQDAATKAYVDSAVTDETLAETLIAGNSAGANTIDMNTQKIVNVGTPTLATDAATKGYVDTNTVSENIYTADGGFISNRTVTLTDVGETGLSLTLTAVGLSPTAGTFICRFNQADMFVTTTASINAGFYASQTGALMEVNTASGTHAINLTQTAMTVTRHDQCERVGIRSRLFSKLHGAVFS